MLFSPSFKLLSVYHTLSAFGGKSKVIGGKIGGKNKKVGRIQLNPALEINKRK